MSIHVSIHDVSPAWADEIELALAACAAVGARPALLVVPNFHGAWPLNEHPAYAARLRALQASGHEVYLHGFFHRSRARADAVGTPGAGGRPGRLAWHFAQRIVSGGEAEFRDVSQDEAALRLDEGERMLQAAGLRVEGFVAPAWAMAPWLLPMLAERGYRFAEDHVHVYDPAGQRRRATVVLNWASRSPVRIASTVAWCRVARHAHALLPARIAIHPGDMRVALLRREVDRLLAWAQGDLAPRGGDLLGPS